MVEVVPFEPDDYEEVMALWRATEGLKGENYERLTRRCGMAVHFLIGDLRERPSRRS